jgi:hypothetical protein
MPRRARNPAMVSSEEMVRASMCMPLVGVGRLCLACVCVAEGGVSMDGMIGGVGVVKGEREGGKGMWGVESISNDK